MRVYICPCTLDTNPSLSSTCLLLFSSEWTNRDHRKNCSFFNSLRTNKRFGIQWNFSGQSIQKSAQSNAIQVEIQLENQFPAFSPNLAIKPKRKKIKMKWKSFTIRHYYCTCLFFFVLLSSSPFHFLRNTTHNRPKTCCATVVVRRLARGSHFLVNEKKTYKQINEYKHTNEKQKKRMHGDIVES